MSRAGASRSAAGVLPLLTVLAVGTALATVFVQTRVVRAGKALAAAERDGRRLEREIETLRGELATLRTPAALAARVEALGLPLSRPTDAVPAHLTLDELIRRRTRTERREQGPRSVPAQPPVLITNDRGELPRTEERR